MSKFMKTLRRFGNKVIGQLGSITGWLVVFTITIGCVIILIKEIQWIIRLLEGM